MIMKKWRTVYGYDKTENEASITFILVNTENSSKDISVLSPSLQCDHPMIVFLHKIPLVLPDIPKI